MNLKTSEKKKVKSFVYLPPFFTNDLFDLKEHSALKYLISFIQVLGIPIKRAQEEQEFGVLNNLELCHEILILLWAIEFLKRKQY